MAAALFLGALALACAGMALWQAFRPRRARLVRWSTDSGLFARMQRARVMDDARAFARLNRKGL